MNRPTDDTKIKLRWLVVESIFKVVPKTQEALPDFSKNLFNSLIQYDETVKAAIELIQQQPRDLSLLTEVFKLLYIHFSRSNEKRIETLGKTFLTAIINCINTNFKVNICSQQNNATDLMASTTASAVIMNFLYYSAQLASLFSQFLPQLMTPLQSGNIYLISFFIITAAFSKNDDEIFSILWNDTKIEAIITSSLNSSKLILNLVSFSILCFMSTHKLFESVAINMFNMPNLKTVISFFKSLSDNEIIKIMTPIVIKITILRLSSSVVKDCLSSLITFLSVYMRNDSDNVPLFSYFIDQILSYSDSISFIKQISEKIFRIYLLNIKNAKFVNNHEIYVNTSTSTNNNNYNNSNNNICSENDCSTILAQSPIQIIDDPSLYIKSNIGSSFCVLMEKCNVSPFDNFFPSRLEDQINEVILMAYYIVNHVSPERFPKTTYDFIISPYISLKDHRTITFQLLTYLCGSIVLKYDSKIALSFLIHAVEIGSELASNILSNKDMNFYIVFPSLSRSLKPGKSHPLLAHTIKNILMQKIPNQEEEEISFIQQFKPQPQINQKQQLNQQQQQQFNQQQQLQQQQFNQQKNSQQDQSPLQLSQLQKSDSENPLSVGNSDSTFDIPNFDKISTILTDSAIAETSPTDATILFCSVITSLDQCPDLYSLLPYAAMSISPSFGTNLMKNFPNPTKSKFKFDSLSCYGNALQCLDVTDIYSLAQTFLMLLPGQAMLLLAITLQRLPRKIILSTLDKTMPFVLSNPDEAGRMTALISYSHPDIALSFIDNIIAFSPLRKRSIFGFRFAESNEQALIVIFKIIGYCSIFVEVSFFNSNFVQFATQFLNKYLTHQSKSNELYSASLFAIRKLSFRVNQWQEDHIDHLFPFKDFLVQYVCSYYLDVGDSILGSTAGNSNNLINNSIVSSSFEMVPSILSTLSMLLPLKPLRPSEKHERSVELTAVLIQIANKPDFNSILKSCKQFFCALLSCNPTINVFIGIMLPMFPALLLNQEWRKIAELMDSIISSKWSHLNISQSSDVLSKVINNIGILISYILPLTVYNEITIITVNILYSLVSLQCTIRNQILSLPQSIRPSKPDIFIRHENSNETELKNGVEVNEIVCSFLSKYFTTSQTFDVILTLLEMFEGNKLLNEHYLGVAKSIKRLLKERGSEEFRFDGKIVSSLIEASKGKSDFVVSEFIEIVELLLNMRLFSMLSNLITMNDKLSDALFSGIISSILKIENGGKKLLGVISNSISIFNSSLSPSEDDQEKTLDFCCRALPSLGGCIGDLDNDTWSNIFWGIYTYRTKDINNNLIKVLVLGASQNIALNENYMKSGKLNNSMINSNNLKSSNLNNDNINFFGNKNYDNYFELAKIITDERILVLPILLSNFPENPEESSSAFFINLSIAFAAASSESCNVFMEYAIAQMSKKVGDFFLFSSLKKVFDIVGFSEWEELCESLTSLFIQYMRNDRAVVDCVIVFLNKTEDQQLRQFWRSFSVVCCESLTSWISILKRLIEEGNPIFESFTSLLPLIIVSCKINQEFDSTIRLIANIVKAQPLKSMDENNIDNNNSNKNYCCDENDDILNVCQNIIKCDSLSHLRADFLNGFVTLMNDIKYVNVCSIMIGSICVDEEITDNNCFALSALIGQLPSDDRAYNFVIDTLLRLLK